MNYSNNKRIAKNTFYLYVRMFLVMLVSMYTVRVVLGILGIEDYGVYGAIGGLITSLAFVTSVLANASQRFFSVGLGEQNDKKMSTTFSMMLWLYLIAGVVGFFLFETLGRWFLLNKMIIPEGRMDAAMWVFHCMILSFVISLVNAPYNALIIAHERMTVYAYVGILDVSLKLLIVYLLAYFPFDKLKLYAILLIFTSLIITVIYVIYCLKRFKESRFKFVWDFNIFKDVFSFSSWTLFGSVSYICNTQGINLMLNVFFGPIANAAYSIGNQIKSLVNQFSGNFYAAVRPSLMKAYSSNSFDYVNDLFFYSSKIVFVLLFIIVFPIYRGIYFLLELWLGSVGEYMVEFIQLMLIYAIILSMSDPITTVIQAANKVKTYYLIVDSFTLLTLPFTYIVFKLGAPPTYAFYISILVFLVAHFIRLYLFMPLTSVSIAQYSKIIIFPIILVIVISTFVSIMINLVINNLIMNKFFIYVILLASNFFIAFTSCLYIMLNKAERAKVVQLIKNKIHK